jgi:hypothetical protein
MDCTTVADPFLLRRDGRWHMFFEALNASSGRGEIAFAISEDCLAWTYGGMVLREDFHVSYPHVFEHGGTVYMIPETRQADMIALYAAYSFPHDWRPVSVLVRGYYADATVFFYDGKWRMFAQRGVDEMRLFSSTTLECGWEEHPGNPFWVANRVYCRPGGRMLRFDGEWYRLAQDGLVRYGSNVRAMHIRRLTNTEFEEREIESGPILLPSFRGWNARGMHHLDAVEISAGEWLGAVDGNG